MIYNTQAFISLIVLNNPIMDVERLQKLELACRDSEIDLLRVNLNLKPVSAVS